jgi:hypothetical protein
MAAKTQHKKWAVKIQHCPISSKFDNSKKFMKFCPVVPEICCGHIHVPKKERRKIIIKIRNGTKTISLQTFLYKDCLFCPDRLTYIAATGNYCF